MGLWKNFLVALCELPWATPTGRFFRVFLGRFAVNNPRALREFQSLDVAIAVTGDENLANAASGAADDFSGGFYRNEFHGVHVHG